MKQVAQTPYNAGSHEMYGSPARKLSPGTSGIPLHWLPSKGPSAVRRGGHSKVLRGSRAEKARGETRKHSRDKGKSRVKNKQP